LGLPDASLAQAHRRLGNIAHLNQAYGEALEHYQVAAELDPANLLILVDVAKAHYAAGNVTEGIEALRQAIERESRQDGNCPADWYALLGRWYRAQNRTESAIQAYEDALRCAPEQPEARKALDELK
jgi:cytochrome c-type biogenesis protein CcmH/NrfG